ncbi:MAG: hypothetical protein AB7W37_03350, partial [Syntrophobacteraceae bacterium]
GEMYLHVRFRVWELSGFRRLVMVGPPSRWIVVASGFFVSSERRSVGGKDDAWTPPRCLAAKWLRLFARHREDDRCIDR